MKALIWKEENLGADYDEIEIPADLRAKAQDLHTKLVDMAVEEDEKLLEAYLDGKQPTVDELKACIRKGTCGFRFVPVLCGAAFKNKGVQPLLDAVVDYLPSPLDKPPVEGHEAEIRRKDRTVPPTTRRRSQALPSRSWTIRSSARSPSCGSIPAR